MSDPQSRLRVAIIGAGSIGVSFAIVFARAGAVVRLFDPDLTRSVAALTDVIVRLRELERYRMLDEAADDIADRISIAATLDTAVADADFVEECAPEKVELKIALFAELDRAAPPSAILASASSALPASNFAATLKGRDRCLIAHPCNPPYLLPVVEIVPAAFTDPDVVQRTISVFRDAGMQPVLISKEIDGFVLNRLQGAVLREAYCLVRDGIASVEDIDTVMRDCLAPRWSVVGPFETADLNTRGGIVSHAEKMGPAYQRMGAMRGQHDPWTDDLVAEVEKARRSVLPLDQWEARVRWRDRALMALARQKKDAGG